MNITIDGINLVRKNGFSALQKFLKVIKDVCVTVSLLSRKLNFGFGASNFLNITKTLTDFAD